ncbi:Crp/Fnr family transcriptional regulator [Streptomyces mirabilis]
MIAAGGVAMGLLGNELAFARALTPQERESVMALGSRKHYVADAHLLTEGDRSSHVLIIIRGWVTVSVATDRGATRLILGLRGPGELLGEMAALDPHPRSATVRALGPTETQVISGDAFRRFLALHPRVSGLVIRQLTFRLRSADQERSALASLTVLQRLAGRLTELAVASRRGRPAGSRNRDGDLAFGTVLDRLPKNGPYLDVAAAMVLGKADLLRFQPPVDRWLGRAPATSLDPEQTREESRDVYGLLRQHAGPAWLRPFDAIRRCTLHVASATGGQEDKGRYPAGAGPRRVLEPLLALLALHGMVEVPGGAEAFAVGEAPAFEAVPSARAGRTGGAAGTVGSARGEAK